MVVKVWGPEMVMLLRLGRLELSRVTIAPVSMLKSVTVTEPKPGVHPVALEGVPRLTAGLTLAASCDTPKSAG
jgi:hypothetical protein